MWRGRGILPAGTVTASAPGRGRRLGRFPSGAEVEDVKKKGPGAAGRSRSPAHLADLIQRDAAVGLGPDGPVGNFAVQRRLPDEHVVKREVVADGILRGSTGSVSGSAQLPCQPSRRGYLPSRLGHLSEVGEALLDPGVDLLQRHPPVPVAVDGKLDQCHVGVRRPLRRRLVPARFFRLSGEKLASGT